MPNAAVGTSKWIIKGNIHLFLQQVFYVECAFAEGIIPIIIEAQVSYMHLLCCKQMGRMWLFCPPHSEVTLLRGQSNILQEG